MPLQPFSKVRSVKEFMKSIFCYRTMRQTLNTEKCSPMRSRTMDLNHFFFTQPRLWWIHNQNLEEKKKISSTFTFVPVSRRKFRCIIWVNTHCKGMQQMEIFLDKEVNDFKIIYLPFFILKYDLKEDVYLFLYDTVAMWELALSE